MANTLREAAVEISSEAEIDAAKMEKLTARRLSAVGKVGYKNFRSNWISSSNINRGLKSYLTF